MRYLISILLFFPVLLNAQFIVTGGGPSTQASADTNYYYAEFGIDVGQTTWTITGIEREADSLWIEVNDTALYQIIGDSTLAFTNRASVVSPDPLTTAVGGFSVYDEDTKIQYATEDADTLEFNVGGYEFKIEKIVGGGGYTVLDSLGYTAIGGTPSTSADLRATTDVASASGTLDTIWVYMGGEDSGDSLIVGVYDDDESYPGTLLGSSDVTAGNQGGDAWIPIPLSSSVSITNGVTYWVAYQVYDSGRIGIRYNSVGTRYNVARVWDRTLPATYPGSGSSGNYSYSIFGKIKE